MSEEMVPITVRILDKEYRIASPAEERDSLVASAAYLDQKMREVREGGRTFGLDRIAVMAALNIAHELLQEQNSDKSDNQDVSLKLRRLQGKVEQALKKYNQMEL